MNNTPLKKQPSSLVETYNLDPRDPEAWCKQANIHWEQSDFDKAADCCLQVLALNPNHFETNVIFGNVLSSQGKHNESLICYLKAIRTDPNNPVAHCNLGNIYSILKKDDDAAESYQTAIQIDPTLLIAFYNLGILRLRQGAYDKAVNNFKRAITLRPEPEQLDLIKQQGSYLTQDNHLTEAKTLYTQLCLSYPTDVQSWLKLGMINASLGNIDEAGDCCRRVLALEPNNDQAHAALGNVCFHHRRLDEARDHYQRALSTNPCNIAALNNFGNACQSEKDINSYIELYRAAVERLPDPTEARATFSKILRNALPTEYEPWLDHELQTYFLSDGFDDKFVSRVSARLLRLKYDIPAALNRFDGRWLTIGGNLAADQLFTSYLERTVNADPYLEHVLMGLRRELLSKFLSGNALNAADLHLIAAVAQQCFNNEYVMAMDLDESRIVSDLRSTLEEEIPSISMLERQVENKLLVFGMYEGLHSLSCRDHLGRIAHTTWSARVRGFLQQAVLNPLEEESLKQDTPTIGAISDKTSRLVQSHYEENPYPRWLSLPEDKHKDLKPLISQLFPNFTLPPFLDGPIRILIAGCGTGKHAIQSSYYNNVELTAIDMSLASLVYAKRMARQYGVTNVEFIQADILELDKLDTQFHIIECVGVLHHMENPMAGWRVLTDLLIDGGLMSIGLYSELARRAIVAARAIIQHEGLEPNQKNISEFRNKVLRHELGDELFALRNYNDFYSSSECRDLLFHSTEHRYTLPQIRRDLDELGLDFVGFVFDNMNTPSMYRNLFPADVEMKDLQQWDRFEQTYPNTFIGMYKFWCQRNYRSAH